MFVVLNLHKLLYFQTRFDQLDLDHSYYCDQNLVGSNRFPLSDSQVNTVPIKFNIRG